MALELDIPNTEIFITTGQVEVLIQDLVNFVREREDDFDMMSNSSILDAVGKAPLGAGVFTEIVVTVKEGNEGPWTIRFEDEATQHTKIRGGTILATDSFGDPRNLTTNPALTINQSISGVLVETGTSGLTATESTQLNNMYKAQKNRLETDPVTGKITLYDDDDSTVLLQGDLFEDVAATQPYRGQGVERRNRMT